MTPEIEAYQRELAAIDRHLKGARRELQDLISGAAVFDLVLTIETVPLQPLAMGHVAMRGNVRISHARYRRLEELRAAAKASEVRDA